MDEILQNKLKHAREELSRVGFVDLPVGKAILNYIEESYKLSEHNPYIQTALNKMIPNLIDMKVISPITEDDFELVDVDSGNGTIFQISRCTRYEYLYKSPTDGKYYDDRAVAFVNKNPMNGKMYMYQGGNSSKREVELPYIPQEEIVYID